MSAARESTARRKIRQAVEARGYALVELRWSPWGAAAEKEGIPGGWEGWVDPVPHNEIVGVSLRFDPLDIGRMPDVMGLSWQEAVEWGNDFLPDRSARTAPMEPDNTSACSHPEHPGRGGDSESQFGSMSAPEES